MYNELEWCTGTPDGFVVAVFERFNGVEIDSDYGVYNPEYKEWTDGNYALMDAPDRWVHVTDYIAWARSELAAKDAEIERLRGVMQVAVDYLFDVSSVSVHSEWKMFVEAKRLLFQALQKGKPDEQAHT